MTLCGHLFKALLLINVIDASKAFYVPCNDNLVNTCKGKNSSLLSIFVYLNPNLTMEVGCKVLGRF